MVKFFDKFPKITYDISGDSNYRVMFTNLLLRFKVLEAVKGQIYAYFDYSIPEGDTIEVLAEKYYGDPEYHWLIAIANDMTDPLTDWPRSYHAFNNYIVSKYGSSANAEITIHHYEQVITRYHSVTDTTDVIKLEIDANTYNTMASSSLTNYTLKDGTNLAETITKSQISNYEWEQEQNESKRQIRLIKKEYLPQILKEFDDIMTQESSILTRRGLRTLRA